MWNIKYVFLVAVLTASFNWSNGCQMDGVNNWLIPVTQNVYDIHRGSFFTRTTSDITGISSVNYGEGLNSGPYVTVSHSDAGVDITTNNAFINYEERETVASMSFTVVFSCTGGSTRSLVFLINIIDTNNNSPQFLPNDQFEFVIAPPLPPGFQITGCVNDITVRDIDLTTQRIDFTIEDNPYFEIEYDAAASTVAKEFKAVLRTTTLIRTLPEVVQLRITATDVDLTGDPPITTVATIRIQGDTDFQLPEEPIFSQPFYLASYTEEHQINLLDPISLRQGYHEDVEFALDGDYSSNFGLVINGNQLTLNVTSPLSSETIRTGQVILVVKAERQYTSGATTTVIVQLPGVDDLAFEKAQYEGRIVDNVLDLSPLVLTQGYEDGFSVDIIGEHSSFFTPTVQTNRITLTMSPLNTTIINENNFITLQVAALTNYSMATTIIALEIIKDDNITPAFESAIYMGAYDPASGLTLEQIALVQGYDDTVSVVLEGEQATYFQLVREGPIIRVNLRVPSLPTQLFPLQQLLLIVQATKPRTVGANAVIYIDLPPARELAFEASSYKGTLQDIILTLPTIVLSVGYNENVTFDLSGDHANSFRVTNEQNQVTVIQSTPLAESVISNNNFLILNLAASGDHALTASTTVLLEIIKQDVTTPVFSQNIYLGTYTDSTIDFDNITLVQGLDSTVSFELSGEHAHYFSINNTGSEITLSLDSLIPEDIIFNEKVIFITVLANKPLTVGANAAIAIKFPQELTEPTQMRFAQHTYIGTIEEGALTLGNLILETGYANGTEFVLAGEHASYFRHTSIDNVVTISMVNIPNEILDENKFILLELKAQRERAVSVSTSVIIDIIKQDRILPTFSEAYYRGVYTEDGLHFDGLIYLSEGYDETVTFSLEGAQSSWFSFSQNGSSVTVNLDSAIPESILENNNQLLFTIVASKPDNFSGRAVISIDLPKDISDPVVLRFTRNSYVGSIDDGELKAPTITIVGGNNETQLNFTGEYASYFRLSRVNNDIEIQLITELPTVDDVFLILEIEASAPDAVSGYTILIIELIRELEQQIVTPVFSQAYYSGAYSVEDGLLFEHTVQLIQGFDESVVFTLAGDDARWFELVNNGGNNISLAIKDDGLQQIEDRSHLVFSIVANKADSNPGRAAVVISLTDLSINRPLRFTQNYYLGSVENNNLTIDAITLEEGYSTDLNFSFTGDYVDYFQLTNEGGVFTLRLLAPLPTEITDDNNVLIFTLKVQTTSNRASTAIIVEIVKNDVVLAFEKVYYVSSYSENDGLQLEPQITLIEGYDESVSFSLEGDQSQWFDTVRSNNTVSLSLRTPVPSEVLADNHQLIFVVLAQRVGSRAAKATIVISLIDEQTTILSFERNSYLGSIQTNNTNIGPIRITEGYTQNISLTLLGDLSSYFIVSSDVPNITVILRTEIPDDLVPENRIVLLELQATAPLSVPAYTTLVFKVEQEAIDQLVFLEAYYTGLYTEAETLVFERPATLAQGYDENVEFALEGDSSQYFRAAISGNSITIELITTIPLEVLVNHEQLIFVIRADKPGSITARTAVVISLVNEVSEISVLGFEKQNYLGSIENNITTLEQITLYEGYNANVTFAASGALSTFFIVTNEGPNVTIGLRSIIPEDSIPANRIIILDLQASATNAVSAHATIIFVVIKEEVDNLVFSETYYTGLYSESDSLVFENAITLTEGYDDSVVFSLEGDATQWIGQNITGNSVILTLTAPIPVEVLTNNQQLILVITASRPGRSTRATIVISLVVENTNIPVLSFEKNSYLGYLENNTLNVEPITLVEGNNVSLSLHGELSTYFTPVSDGATITIRLSTPIPEQTMPSNGIIILGLQATAPTAISAYATIVLQVIQEDAPTSIELVFDKTYYTGHYTEANGLVFETNVVLVEGYDVGVQFGFEGDSSQWFRPVISGNSVSLELSSPIPPAVLANNQQLIFIIRAQLESASARATIVISLKDEYNEDAVLGFERISYLGTIENNTANLDPITLNEGYSENVLFTLHGELSTYFRLLQEGPSVTIALQNIIPEDSIPRNRIIALELQASSPPMIPAFATIVFEVIQENIPASVELTFSQSYYTGHYTEADGLVFETNMTLTESYEDVQFNLEGDSSQWFRPVISGNSVSLALSSPIPPAVLANNQQLIFVIRAQIESATARATIVISLNDEYNEDAVLGFERISYLGTIENNTANLDPITLNEGYSENVLFTLHGELSTYFRLLQEGPSVTIALQNIIPEDSIPRNRIIALELQASSPPMIPAFATIVFEVLQENIPASVELTFSQSYYTGHYTEADGLVFETNMTLTESYEDVQFNLEGDSSQWFRPVISGNSVSLALSSPIPPAVLANNQQLIFVIRAQIESATARATIVISLNDEYNEDAVLGFERISYLGTIENNTANLDPITLNEGYSENVLFTLHGELSTYFRLLQEGPSVTIALQNIIPEDSIPRNRIIALELQASSPPMIPAFATIVFEVIQENIPASVELTFSQSYYTGHYTEADGLVFETNMTLTESYEYVQFTLEGDSSQWFRPVISGNSVSLAVSSLIPPAVLANNQQLIFVIRAQIESATARATIVISLKDEYTEDTVLGFVRVSYLGTIENNTVNLEPITLNEGYSENVLFTLHGELSTYFRLLQEGPTVTIALQNIIPEDSIPRNGIIALELQASSPPMIPAFATIVFEVVQEDIPASVELTFSQSYYTGHYTEADGLVFETNMTLTESYEEDVRFALEGDNSQWFRPVISGNSVSLALSSPIPPAVLANNQQLIFVIRAQLESAIARATIVISLIDEYTHDLVLGFERISYFGTIHNNTITLDPIVLTEGYTDNVSFSLHGDLSDYFRTVQEGSTVNILLQNSIPEESIPMNRIINLELQATALSAIPALTTIILQVSLEDVPVFEQLVFSDTYYTGHYTDADGLIFDAQISLIQGFNGNVRFALEGESSLWFRLETTGNAVLLELETPIPPAVLINNQQLIFTIRAEDPDSMTARATIVILLTDEYTNEAVLGFNRISYFGTIANDITDIETIVLSEGYRENVTFILRGDLSSYFSLRRNEAEVSIVLPSAIPEESLPENEIILLELQASAPDTASAFATIIFKVMKEAVEELIFSEPFYMGQYTETDGLIFETPISLATGYEPPVEFTLEGENSNWFGLEISQNLVMLTLQSPIPQEVLTNHRQLVFVITAQRVDGVTARAPIIVTLENDADSGSGSDVTFNKVLYEGLVQAGVVQHETITISEYNGTEVDVLGEFAALFTASSLDGVVNVRGIDSVTLSTDVTFVSLELRAGGAGTALILDVIPEASPALPSVTFSSPSYIIRVDITQSGRVGQVSASADNGEAVSYSLLVDDAHLLQRLSVDSEGGMHLSAPANSGVYSLQVVATTVFTQITASAPIHLTVDAITVCADDIVVPPLIILDRDEELEHTNLVVIGSEHEGCRYRLNNRWPIDQPWLYVDATGLHTRRIDREHESIAFMALSQVQVELILECDSDNNIVRTKRSIDDDNQTRLGPYDYGDNQWALTDSILYNSRRSLVNLIVNDINDNDPIFVGKEDEPLLFGYPIPELEERVLPRALAELKATDADIGVNAELVYWSSEEALAVSPLTGSVHVRQNTLLENDSVLTVLATDLRGDGNTGNITIQVKLIDTSHIAVVTVTNAFLDDEQSILFNLSSALGYEVRGLRSAVISESEDTENRKKRDVPNSGATLQLYVYGLMEREPVDVDRLTGDINSNAITTVIIASTVSLEDHLEGLEICDVPGRDTGLLVATIVLSVLLFILIVAIAVWFFLKWRKEQNYQQFSDANSLASRNESLPQIPKPENAPTPRLNIEQLKRSERRLQEMLDAPIDDVLVQPTSSKDKTPVESKVNIPEPQPQAPLVIQSIDKLKDVEESDDEDEFGERAKNRRKSVVTFNENVEKIIVDDPLDDSSLPDYEVYKF